MSDLELAALKRKYLAACDSQSLAKRDEFAHKLALAGVDVNALGTVSEPSVAPSGRTPNRKVTTEQTKPVATVEDDALARWESDGGSAETNKTSNETAAKAPTPRRRPGRPRKTETTS
jgi:hypothetical protein